MCSFEGGSELCDNITMHAYAMLTTRLMGSVEPSLTLNVNDFFFPLYFYNEIITVIFTLLPLQREFSLRVLGNSLVV